MKTKSVMMLVLLGIYTTAMLFFWSFQQVILKRRVMQNFIQAETNPFFKVKKTQTSLPTENRKTHDLLMKNPFDRLVGESTKVLNKSAEKTDSLLNEMALLALADIKHQVKETENNLLQLKYQLQDSGNLYRERNKSATRSFAAKPNVANISTNHGSSCASWCTRGKGAQPPYFLTAVLLVRIYREDLPQLSTRELLQWLVYLRYAGVEHVYVYDAYHKPEESQKLALKHLIKEGYVTYTDWSKYAKPYGIEKTQLSAYDHCRIRWGGNTIWHTATDIDEYPFSPIDTKPGFLSRVVKTFSKAHPAVVEFTMGNFLFLGKPLDDVNHFMLTDRIIRRTPNPANRLVKPIYKPKFVSKCSVHHNVLLQGQVSQDAPVDQLRMNHYWGARVQNWGEDTPKILSTTIPDETIRVIVKEILGCDKCIRLYRLKEKRWNR